MSSSRGESVTPVTVRGPRAMSRKMLRVAGMEFKRTTTNKAFVVITIIGPFLIVAMSVLPSILAMSRGGATAERGRANVGVLGLTDHARRDGRWCCRRADAPGCAGCR